jgi:hypothetical protein
LIYGILSNIRKIGLKASGLKMDGGGALRRMDQFPLNFIDEPVEAVFNHPPLLLKSPPCPDAFIWRGETYAIAEMLGAWQDYRRRGRMGRNMRPEHAATAALRGSWGVGRFFFRVRAETGRVFDLYYDRAPESAGDRKGHWFLLGERRII